MQGSSTKQKLTFAQLLYKYTKAVPKDRPLKKDQVHLHVKASILLLGENPASVHYIIPFSESVRYYVVGVTGIGFFLSYMGA